MMKKTYSLYDLLHLGDPVSVFGSCWDFQDGFLDPFSFQTNLKQEQFH